MRLIDLPETRDRAVRRYGALVRELHGVDPLLIAAELGIAERTVLRIQRKLGLRACQNNRN